jgi:hypothetical protein
MFSDEQIKFMKKQGIKISFNKPLNDEELEEIDDYISHLLQIKGFDKDYKPTPIGIMAESIMDTLATI